MDRSTLMDLPGDAGLRELLQATLHPEAASKSRTVVTFDEYSREMANFINRRLTELQEAQRIPLSHQIQVMAVTCFYWQPTTLVERFQPLALYARLVSLIHTHGIHLDILARAQAEDSNTPNKSGSRLFKCVYALDRVMGAMGARPFMFNNVDLIRIPQPEPHDPPIFRLFMSLVGVLDHVVELYRPNPKISYVEVPVFERMAIEAGAQCESEIHLGTYPSKTMTLTQADHDALATLEVLYHAISVLSVRMPRHRFRNAPECDSVAGAGPRIQHLPPSSVNARRSHSADRILDVIKDYRLGPLPFVPYALALSLSVAYRKWRFSRLSMFRTRGGADFKKVLPVLQEMGKIWSSARINGQLGQAVMLKLDRKELNKKRAKEAAAAAKAKQQQAAALLENTPLPTTINENTIGQLPTTTTNVDLSPDDAIPIPGDLLSIAQPTIPPESYHQNNSNASNSNSNNNDPSPLGSGLPEGNVEDFLMDDDALFRAWDPMFAQSVDFSFSSILDPGNPFAWPEYCNYGS
ncbi:hypothetical protein N0V88_007724 [Collariella sp. IMI 366227]|nr:hypothetical protein N0V88_007724 [Collariella sp. IMI 366227]